GGGLLLRPGRQGAVAARPRQVRAHLGQRRLAGDLQGPGHPELRPRPADAPGRAEEARRHGRLAGRGEGEQAGGLLRFVEHAGRRLSVVGPSGETVVSAAKPECELIARNPRRETTRASIAVSDGELFIRTYKHLWCIAKK